MCGRITLKAPADEVAQEFALVEAPQLTPRYNIAPTQPVAAVRTSPDGGRVCDNLVWGLIPPWSTDPRTGAKMFNARSETVGEKPAFRESFASRRCLIPVDGFYEWRKQGGRSLPHYISAFGGELLAFAGLWERWEYPGGEIIESCSILTTAANRFMRKIHHRMPVIVAPDDRATWLSRTDDPTAALDRLLRPTDEMPLRCWPVSTLVNVVANDGPELIAPAHHSTPGQLDLF